MLKITKVVSHDVAAMEGCSKYTDQSCGIMCKQG